MRKRMQQALIGILALSMLPLSGCAQQQADENKLNIYVICKSKDPYWDATKAGALEAGEEMNLNVIYDAPDLEGDEYISVQASMIDQAIANGADAIVLAAQDMDKLNDSLRTASNKSIPILTIDSDVSYAGRASFIGTQNEAAGAIAAREAVSLIGEEGEIGIICHKFDTQTAVERRGGFIDEIEGGDDAQPVTEAPTEPETDEEGNPIEGETAAPAPAAQQTSGYPNVKIVDTKYCDGDIDKSYEGTRQLIMEHPDIKLIYATNQPGTVGACRAIADLGVSDTVQLVGFDYFDGADVYITNGVLDGVIAQNPYNMGYLGVRYAKKLVNDENVAALVDTGATLVTKNNLDDADIQWLVNPTAN